MSSAHASSGPSPVELSLLLPFSLRRSNIGGGELAFELDMLDGGRRGVALGDDAGDERASSPFRELALLADRWCAPARSSSTARSDGWNPFAVPALAAATGQVATMRAHGTRKRRRKGKEEKDKRKRRRRGGEDGAGEVQRN